PCRRARISALAGWRRAFRPAPARAAEEGSSVHLSISVASTRPRPQITFPQIGAALPRQPLRLTPAPGPDLSVVARHHPHRPRALVHPPLLKPPPPRRQHQQWPRPPRPRDRRVEHVRSHHHSRPAAQRRVVDGAVFIARKIPDVYRFELPQARFQRL